MLGGFVVPWVGRGPTTLPVGVNPYVPGGLAPEIAMGDIFGGCGRFVFVDIINVVILVSIPQIVLFLPETMIR